ncbi:MAG: serine/threonine-protein kinase [Pirellulales bacterium]
MDAGRIPAEELAEDLELVRRAYAAGSISEGVLHEAERRAAAGQSILELLEATPDEGAAALDLFARFGGVGRLRNPADSQEAAAAADTSVARDAGAHDTDPTTSPPERLPGLPDRYVVQHYLGGGGMGRVHLALDRQLKRRVAIKVLKPGRGGGDWTQFLRRESELLARLQHQGIVPVYDIGQLEDGAPFIVMQYVEGESLDEYAATHRLGWRELAALVQQVAAAVGHAHLVKIVHRDLKPGNIRVTNEGLPVVLDFGIAKAVESPDAAAEPSPDRDDDGDWGFLASLAGAGTPAYMSPEQAAGRSVDLRSDVYSLGVILYTTVAGRLPWSEELYRNRVRLAATLATAAPELPPECELPPADFRSILARCLAPQPDQRYPTALALAADLERFLDGFPVEAHQASHSAVSQSVYRVHKFAKRHPGMLFTVAGLLLLAMAALGLSVQAYTSHLKAELSETRRRVEVAESQQRQAAAEQRETLARQRGHEAQLRARIVADAQDSMAHLGAMQNSVSAWQTGQAVRAAEELHKAPRGRAHWEVGHLGLRTGASLRPEAVLPGHEFEVLDAAISPDGKRLATTAMDGRLLIWNWATYRLELELQPGRWCARGRHWRHGLVHLSCCDQSEELSEMPVRLAWSPDGRSVAAVTSHAGRSQGRVVRWDLASRTPRTLHQHSRPFVALAADLKGTLLVADTRGELWTGSLVDGAPWREAPLNRESPGGGEPRDGAQRASDQAASDQTVAAATETAAVSKLIALAPGWWGVARVNGDVELVRETGWRVASRRSFRGPVWDVDYSPDHGLLAVAPNEGQAVLQPLQLPDASLDQGPQWGELRRYLIPSAVKDAQVVPHSVRLELRNDRLIVGDSAGRVSLWNLAAGALELQLPARSGVGPSGDRSKLPPSLRRNVTLLALSPSGERLWTAGAVPDLRSWQVGSGRYVKSFRAPSRAAAAFDRRDPRWIWMAAPGRLELWDGQTGEPRASLPLGAGLSDLRIATALASDRVVTARDGVLQPWRIANSDRSAVVDESPRIVEDGPAIAVEGPIDDVALSPDGRFVAAYLAGARVAVWTVADGRRMAGTTLSEAGRPRLLRGRLMFHPQGSELLVCGPGQIPYLLERDSLREIRRPGISAGDGPTALAWHPRRPELYFAGDTEGRVRDSLRSRGAGSPASVAMRALAMTSDGRRLASIDAKGTIQITDADWVDTGTVLTFPLAPQDEEEVEIRAFEFDPTDRRLLVLTEEGRLTIWEAQATPSSSPPPVEKATPWSVADHRLGSTKEAHYTTRPRAAALVDDKVAALLLRESTPYPLPIDTTSLPDFVSLSYVLFRESEGDRSLAEVDREANVLRGRVGQTNSSLALRRSPHTRQLTAVYSKPATSSSDWLRQMHLAHLHDAGKTTRERIGEPANYGVQTALHFDFLGRAHVTHFNWSGGYTDCCSQERVGGPFVHLRASRQGEELSVAAVDSLGRLHLAGLPKRWNSDSQGVLLYRRLPRLGAVSWSEVEQGAAASGSIASPHWLAIDEHDRPTVTYHAHTGDDPWSASCPQLMLACRDGDGWRQEVVLDSTLPRQYVSPHLPLPDGRFAIVYALVDPRQYSFRLAMREPSGWKHREIYTLPVGDDALDEAAATSASAAKPQSAAAIWSLSLDRDSQGRLVVACLMWRGGEQRLLVMRSPPMPAIQ